MVAVVATLVLTVAMLSALADVGRVAVDRTRARSAADAAALAGLAGGRPEAEAIAARNGAVLTRWSDDSESGQVMVSVEVGEARASARASDGP